MTSERNVGGRPPRSSRAAVVDAGLEILRNDGLSAVTLGAIGDRLGLHKVGLYTYVKSKDDLLLAMRDEVYRRQLEALHADDDLAPEVALKAVCGRLVGLMTDYGQLMVTVEADLTGPGLEFSERFFEKLAAVGLKPAQQLQVYILLTSLVLNTVSGSFPSGQVASTTSIAQDFPHLLAILNAFPTGDTPLQPLTDGALSLIIDVLIPALRESNGDW